MSDSDNSQKETLKVAPTKLSLTKTVEGGQVRQNFTRGRSKTVTVEVKRTRNFSRDGGKMVEVQGRSGQRGALTQGEQEARLEALRRAEETRKQDAERAAQAPVAEAQDEPVKAATAAEPDLQIGAVVIQPSSRRSDVVVAPERAKKPDEDDSAKKKEKRDKNVKIKLKEGGAGGARRNAGKLTVTQALNYGEGERMRSLSSLRRQREKARKGDMGGDSDEKIIRDVVIPEAITVQELANRMAERVADVVKALMKMGVMATATQSLDADTAELIVSEFGHRLKRVSESDVENVLRARDEEQEDPAKMAPRPPVVTIMGHVDHGKTSLLDALRKTDVVAGEAGGITQHIGAYQVQLPSDARITFLDTPGHEAFSLMRARGAQVTDIVVLVVAADDGVMEQTKEAIAHAKAAGVPIIVACNKIDKPDADSSRVKNELMQYELVPEEFGGDIQVIEVSAKVGTGLDKLEEAILLQAEMMELKANHDREASGSVIEAKIERGRGSVATVLIQRGRLKVGDIVVAGASYGRVRAILNDKGQQIKEAGPSMPVEVLGLGEPPEAGDSFSVVADERTARDITEYRGKQSKNAAVVAGTRTMEQLFAAAGKDAVKELPLIIKADVQGSVEAIAGSVQKFNGEEVAVRILHTGVGGISESDISLAQTTGAFIIAFNVRATNQAKQMADRENVDIRYYSVIYNVVDDIRAALSGMLSPVKKENFIGYAEIREVFNITKVGKVGGCYVTEGTVRRGAGVRLLRDNVVIHEGTLKTLKRFKDEVKEVKSGYECGMAFENYEDIKQGDVIEAFEIEEVSREVEAKAS